MMVSCVNLSAQSRGGELEATTIDTVSMPKVTVQGKQWAIFIAIDQYREWGTLLYPVKDAQGIKKILEEYYVIDVVKELYNKDATAEKIRELFTELQDQTGPNDSVFVFHAGHGFNEERSKTSFWIPTDGGKAEEIHKQLNWLSHGQIRSYLDSLKARHVFLISDSCFSGDFLDATKRGVSETVINYPSAYDRKSRQAMSSGASEEVDDLSEFASRLKDVLMRTETPYITPDYLLSRIKEAQTIRQLNTIPILAVIPGTDHVLGGSFLFFRKNPKQTVQPIVEQPMPVVNPVVVKEPALPVPGETGYFVGSWIGSPENSSDVYLINLMANGRCTVKIINDNAEQLTTGNWSWDAKNKKFRLNAVFREVKISYMRAIDWVSLVRFAGSNSFNIFERPATGAPNLVKFTFFRD